MRRELSGEEVYDKATLRRMSSYIDPTQKWDKVEEKTVRAYRLI